MQKMIVDTNFLLTVKANTVENTSVTFIFTRIQFFLKHDQNLFPRNSTFIANAF